MDKRYRFTSRTLKIQQDQDASERLLYKLSNISMKLLLTVIILDQDICHIGLTLDSVVGSCNSLIKFKFSHYQLIILINIILHNGKTATGKFWLRFVAWWKGKLSTR